MSPAPEETSKPLDLNEILRILLRRRWLLLAPWMAAVGLGVAASVLLKPVYFSTVTMTIERPQALSGPLGGMVGGGLSTDREAEVMREQVSSTYFLKSVVTASGIKNDPGARAWALRYRRSFAALSEDEAIEAALANHLRKMITIKRDRGDVLVVTVGDRSGENARKLAQAVADAFVASSKAAQLEAVRATQEFSTEQQQIYKHKLDDSEARLDAAQRTALASGISSSAVGAANLPQARALLDQAGVDVDEQRQKLTDLKNQLAGKARENDIQLVTTPRARGLIADLLGLQRQLSAAALSGGDGTSVRLAIGRKVSDLETELTQAAASALPSLTPDARDLLVRVKLADADLATKEAGRAYLSAQVAQYGREVVSAPDRDNSIAKLKAEVENNRALYNTFLQQSAAAQIQEAFENAKVSGRFVVLEPPVRAQHPGKPNRMVLILLSFVVGGIIGVGSVLVAEHHDQSVKNAEEVENLVGLPVLGAVPRVEELERSRRRPRNPAPGLPAAPVVRDSGLLHRLKTESPLGLEFRRIYLKLAKTRGRALPHTLMVTSSTRGEGKTTTAACLAITLARELRQKVLVVDFDLRSPSLHRALGLPSSSWGVAQMLQSRNFDERFVRSTVLPHLDFLGAGKSDRPASELIDTEAAEWFLQEARNRYALILCDAAPNLAVPDPLMIGRAVEGVIYVIKAGSTVRKAAEYGVRVQREARDNVLGVLMNDVGDVLPHYYGYRYDAYGYTPEVAGGETS